MIGNLNILLLDCLNHRNFWLGIGLKLVRFVGQIWFDKKIIAYVKK
jgi:hypothetical protein